MLTQEVIKEILDEHEMMQDRGQDNLDVSKTDSNESGLWNVANDDQIIYPIWCFGFNEKVPIINLTTASENTVLYPSAHLLIICDVDNRRQRILRGHINQITCLTSSGDKRWIASGDAGANSAVIIWDGKTGDAVRIMIEPHQNGVTAIALTEDARYLATLSAGVNEQEFSIWNWTSGSEKPLCTVQLDAEHCLQDTISFKFGDYSHVVTNSSKRVIFFNWTILGSIEAFYPTLTDDDFNKRIGSFTGSHFLPNSEVAITATTQGLVVVWEKQNVTRQVNEERSLDLPMMKAIKLVTLHEKSITFLTITRCYVIDYAIVTGDIDGVIKFFDTNFMLVFWFQNINAGPIASISFASRGVLDQLSSGFESKDYPQCSTIPGEKFITEDFIVSTLLSNMVLVILDGSVIKFLQRDNHETVTALATHPRMPLLTSGSLTGRLNTFDYIQKTVVSTKEYGVPIQCCQYSPNGMHIAIGFSDGVLTIADPLTLLNITKAPFNYGRGAITQVDFCPSARFCAYSDAAFTTTLLCASTKPAGEPWEYVGRIRAHYRPIIDIRFWRSSSKSASRLFTLGEDQVFTEYDLRRSEKNNVVIRTRFRVEQTSVPLCLGQLPPFYKDDFILLSTAAAKLKLIHATTFTCRKTVMTVPLGIKYRKVTPLPSQGSGSDQFVLCLSRERLALVMLPLDGDPLKSTNVIAHPSGHRGSGDASSLVTSYDGKFVFTAGGPDTCVHMWGLNPDILADRVKSAPNPKRRFYDLLSVDLLEELKDYYYYSMLKVQGMKSFDTRQTSLTIPSSELPFIMRAIGHYPTEEEIQNMMDEIKYSKFSETGLYVNELDLDTFIQMYCNHRPCGGILFSELEQAFEHLCHVRDYDTGRSLYFRDPRHPGPSNIHIPPEFLMSYLQTLGEPFSEWELTEYLAILLGHYPEGANLEVADPVDRTLMTKAVDMCLPMFFNAKNFAQRMLGFKVCQHGDQNDYYALKEEPNPVCRNSQPNDASKIRGADREMQTEQ